MRYTRIVLAAVAVLGAWLSAAAWAEAATVVVKVADEWGTIQPAGPRGPTGGNRNWNTEGGANGTFASSGTLRFYMADAVDNLNSIYPQGWKVTNVTLVAEHDDAAFSLAGGVSVFHFTNDQIAITNDRTVTGDALPGAFAGLGVSPLKYNDAATADGEPVRVDLGGGIPANLGDVSRVSDYNFRAEGDNDLDVLGLALGPPGLVANAVNPAGAIDKAPTYGLNFPDVNLPDETLATFNSEIVQDDGFWLASGFDAVVKDIENGTDPLSFIFTATDPNSTVAATYRGSLFGGMHPPRIYIEAHAIPEPGSLALLALAVPMLMVRRRARD